MKTVPKEYYESGFFDPDEDIILPNSVIGEIYYIYCIILDIFKHRKEKEYIKSEFVSLKRQIKFFKKWIKVKGS